MPKVLVVPDPKLTVSWSLNHSRPEGPDTPAIPHSPGDLLRARREALEGVAQCFCSGSARGQRALAQGQTVPAQPLEALGAFLIDEELLDCEALKRDGLATIFANDTLKCSGPPSKQGPEPGAEDSTPFAQPPKPWHLGKVGVETDPRLDLTGKGVLVGILDSGFVEKKSHPELDGKSIPFQQFDPDGVPIAESGFTDFHGVQVATVLAGKSLGVAPGCDLAVAGVFDQNGTSSTVAQVAAGLNWLLCHSFRRGFPPGVDLVNCSLGFDGCDEGFYAILRHARTVTGKLLIAMIGNEGQAGQGNVQIPGAFEGVVGVGATDASDNVAAFSDWGRVCKFPGPCSKTKPDLCAPGVDILTAGPGGAEALASGTSFATPQVAGAAALLMQKDPALRGDADALETALFQLVTPLADIARGGRGRLDLTKIGASPPAAPPTPPTPPPAAPPRAATPSPTREDDLVPV